MAGSGTRFLPATKATPKEMLPVVDKPAIQYVVEEAVRAGLDDVLLVTGRNKTPLEDHFDRHYELEDRLEGDEGKRDLLDQVRERDRAGDGALRPPGRGPRSRARGAVRGPARRQPAVRGTARRRPHRRARRAAHPDDRGAAAPRRLRDRADRGRRRTRSGCTAARRSRPTDETDVVRITGLVEKPLPGRRAEQPGDHRPLRAGAGDLRRDPRDRRPGAAARSSSPTRSRR